MGCGAGKTAQNGASYKELAEEKAAVQKAAEKDAVPEAAGSSGDAVTGESPRRRDGESTDATARRRAFSAVRRRILASAQREEVAIAVYVVLVGPHPGYPLRLSTRKHRVVL